MSSDATPHPPTGMITKGPGPFVTFRSFMMDGVHMIWRARPHRKGLLLFFEYGPQPFWQRPFHNKLTALCFIAGSLLFMLGATLSLLRNPPSSTLIGWVFFAGSVPFTLGAFLQNLQAANAAGFALSAPAASRRLRIIGWQPYTLGWLSTISQLGGTIAFNYNTYDAIDPTGTWYQQDEAIWVPGMIGSILFLVSAYLAFMETSHAYWSWKPKDLGWQIVAVNLLGCVFFMTAGVSSFLLPGKLDLWMVAFVNVHLWLGAFCFLVAGLLAYRESNAVEKLEVQHSA